jgi:hypothetical protein
MPPTRVDLILKPLLDSVLACTCRPRKKTSIGIEESALFSEPGAFLIRPDEMIYHLGAVDALRPVGFR